MYERARALTPLMRALGLGLDLSNSLDWREEWSTSALIHKSQSFRKKRDGSYLMAPILSTVQARWYGTFSSQFDLKSNQAYLYLLQINNFTGLSKLRSQDHLG